jgi:hypothetical protein
LQLGNSKKQNKVWRRCHGFCVKSLGWYFSILISAEKKWKCLFLSEGTLAHLEPLSGPVQRKLIMVINGPQLFFFLVQGIYICRRSLLGTVIYTISNVCSFVLIEWISTCGKDSQIIISSCSTEEKTRRRYTVKHEIPTDTKTYIYFCLLLSDMWYT